MKEIDLNTWPRREHFHFFRRADIPFYNVNFQLDITGLKEACKARSVSLNNTLMSICLLAMNEVDNFRYRVRGDGVILHGQLHPSFAHLRGEEELFRIVTLDFIKDLPQFDLAVKDAVQQSQGYFDFTALGDRDDFVFFSSMPWVSFTSIDHTINLQKDDGIPRVTWGKFFDENGRTVLPVNLRVNHMFVDGLHVGRLIEAIDTNIAALCDAR